MQLDPAGFLDIDDVLDALHAVTAVAPKLQTECGTAGHARVGFEVPVARLREKVVEVRHLPCAGRVGVLEVDVELASAVGAGVAVGDVLAVHGGAPQAAAELVGVDVVRVRLAGPAVFVAELGVDERHGVHLELDGRQVGARGLVNDVVHPTLVKQRAGRSYGVCGARVLIRVHLLEIAV